MKLLHLLFYNPLVVDFIVKSTTCFYMYSSISTEEMKGLRICLRAPIVSVDGDRIGPTI